MKLSRFINIVAAASMVLAALSVSPSPVIAQGEQPPLPEQPYVPGEIVIGFDGSVADDFAMKAAELADGANAHVARQQENVALLSFEPDVDVYAMANELQSQPGVNFAEPNYIYSLPKGAMVSDDIRASANGFHQNYVLRRPSATVNLGVNPRTDSAGRTINLPGSEGDHRTQAVPIASLRAMRIVGANNTIKATYPNDPYTWWGGWQNINADIVWTNTTASAGICAIDTGVDYLHPDLSTNIIKGYDFVNADALPMDDNGHGTHVAGIMVAIKNNAKGLIGVSTGKVVAVKALDAQGFGTNMDIAAAINYCAARTDIRVINMSLGGVFSNAINTAVNNAVNTKGKLIIAAAGNENTDSPTNSYPAALSVDYPNKVLAVAASGQWYEFNGNWFIDYYCRADTSNYGSWVNVVAPGTSIYSTLPYDKTFYLNSFDPWLDTRYDYMDGTSMAAPYVAAAAARRWGYKPTATNSDVGSAVINNSPEDLVDYPGDGTCWPGSMVGKKMANVAALLDRGAVYGYGYDASTGNPLTGATFQIYRDLPASDPLLGSAIITPSTWRESLTDVDPTRIYTFFNDFAEIINLPIEVWVPVWGDYSFSYSKINKAGYTNSPQSTGWGTSISAGRWQWIGDANVPPKSANFDVVTQWMGWNYDLDQTPDLDSNVWLPDISGSGSLSGQPSNFLVGPEGTDTWFEVDPVGGMTYFPYARLKREGGWVDWLQVENITIRNRNVAHDGLLANPALPYYRGKYTIVITDYGQNSSGVPLLGNDTSPSVFIWKDGVIKWMAWNDCNDHYWKAVTINSGAAGAVTYTTPNSGGDPWLANVCANTMFNPE